MKSKTRYEEIGATIATFVAIPLAFPVYLIECSIRLNRKSPMTAAIMLFAQIIGVIAIRETRHR
jgi:hypothetical protein